ncbi:uncharacterized protein TNCV_2399301 [Trichonephila clavipes]|uniref:Uncharacterized protein n=1 Tax=Trichonephila clavipes TaxID=2585209 RepID=A0A8X6T4X9_TRICX|nr:uncharacterized protein TNCV_2399301 [Trichonephila clavipes]
MNPPNSSWCGPVVFDTPNGTDPRTGDWRKTIALHHSTNLSIFEWTEVDNFKNYGRYPQNYEKQTFTTAFLNWWMSLLKKFVWKILHVKGVFLRGAVDGATCHTARATIDLLKDTFGDRLISRFGPVNWPQRSCDLTPLDYFLWGYVKSLVYADKPQTLDHLEDNIRRVIADIRPQMLEKVIEN